MRSGKTLAMTQEVIARLNRGEVVYTNYRVNWNPDEPMSWLRKMGHALGYTKMRYPKTNLRRFNDWEDVQNIANCTVALDEGWQYFDSYNKLPIEKRMRLYQSGKWELTFLYTVQRYMMADINLRWATDEFWESTLYKIPFMSYPIVIYRLYDLEEDNEGAKLARKGIDEKGNVVDLSLARRIYFTNKKAFDAYDTKEDIYATYEYRSKLSEKVDTRTADTVGTPDPSWSIKSILKKYASRRSIRTKKADSHSVPRPMVAGIHSRNHIINRTLAHASSVDGLMSQKIYLPTQKKRVVNPSLYTHNERHATHREVPTRNSIQTTL